MTLQVRIKLLHPLSSSMMADIVSDFPAAAILSRVGLIQAALEILGATHLETNGTDDIPWTISIHVD
jgi:hypothetical protein